MLQTVLLLAALAVAGPPTPESLLAIDDAASRAELLREALAEGVDHDTQTRLIAALVVVDELGDDHAAPVLAAYLEAAWSDDPATREFAVDAARAGAVLDGEGRPTIVVAPTPPGEILAVAPSRADPAHAMLERYANDHLRLECRQREDLAPAWPESTLLGWRFQWRVIRPDGSEVSKRELVEAVERTGHLDHDARCGRRRICLDLPEAGELVEVYNRALQHSLGLPGELLLEHDFGVVDARRKCEAMQDTKSWRRERPDPEDDPEELRGTDR